jgi:BlaR1 peptidase M56
MTFLHQYLLQASICLTLLYGVYALLLRQDTFHQLNRFFLLLVLVGTVILPVFDLSFFLKNHQEIAQNQVVQLMPDLTFRQPQNIIQISVFQIISTLYWAGVIVFAIRFLVQILSVLSLYFESKSLIINSIKVRILERKLNPFSFFKLIFINPTVHSEEDLAEILAHEYTHARQFHSLDVLLVEAFLVVFWFHPLAWFQRKSLKQNLEFLTDQSVLQSGFDAQRYQYSLLKVNGLKPISELTNSFNFSDLKLRIKMMNRERSARWKVSKYVIAVPVLAFLMLAFNITKGKNFDKKNVLTELVKMARSVEFVAEKRVVKVVDKFEENEELLPIDFTPFKTEKAPVSVSEPMVLVKKDSVKITKGMTFQIWDFEKNQLAEGVKMVLGCDQSVFGVSDANGFMKINVPDAAKMFSVTSREHKFIEGLTNLVFTVYLKDGTQLWYRSDNFCEDLTTLGVSKFGVEILDKLGGKTLKTLVKDNDTNRDITYTERQKYCKMLAIIDGEEHGNLKPEDFDNLLVMYSMIPPKSISAYGEKGKNGVVITHKFNRRSTKETDGESYISMLPNLDKYLETIKNQSTKSPLFLMNGEFTPENYDYENLTKYKRVYVVADRDFDKNKIKDNALQIRAMVYGVYNIVTVDEEKISIPNEESVSVPMILLKKKLNYSTKNILVVSKDGKYSREIRSKDYESLPVFLDGKLIPYSDMVYHVDDSAISESKVLSGNAAKSFSENSAGAETIIVVKTKNWGWEKMLAKMKELTESKQVFYLFSTWSMGKTEPERLEIRLVGKTNLAVDVFYIDFEKDPVIIVDGVRLRRNMVTRNIDTESISTITKISPEKTKELFRETSATGAIIIKTKHL